MHALATADPTLRALPARNGLAETALSASLERSARLRNVGRTYALQAALFAAGSVRWDPASGQAIGADRMYVGALGAGLRLAPMRAGRATIGIDLGFPLARSAQVRSRPFVGLVVTPSLTTGRHRDGNVTP